MKSDGTRPGPVIRDARPDDADAVARLAQELRANLGDPQQHLTPDAIRRDAFGSARACSILVAELNGTIVGHVIYTDIYEPAYAARGLYIADLIVTASARSRGIGRALVEAVTNVARDRQRKFVWWHVQTDNAAALAFYKALDLDVIEPFIVHVRLI